MDLWSRVTTCKEAVDSELRGLFDSLTLPLYDILGIWAVPHDTGKPAGNDIRKKKESYPIVYALEKGARSQRERLRLILGATTVSQRQVSEVLAVLEEVGARDAAQGLAKRFGAEAGEVLRSQRLDSKDCEQLGALIDLLAERDS